MNLSDFPQKSAFHSFSTLPVGRWISICIRCGPQGALPNGEPAQPLVRSSRAKVRVAGGQSGAIPRASIRAALPVVGPEAQKCSFEGGEDVVPMR